jgi:hypothetical protein
MIVIRWELWLQSVFLDRQDRQAFSGFVLRHNEQQRTSKSRLEDENGR